MRGPNGSPAEPERVAVKRHNRRANKLDLDSIQHEADVLKALAQQPFMVPFHSLHLPGNNIHPAYLVMG